MLKITKTPTARQRTLPAGDYHQPNLEEVGTKPRKQRGRPRTRHATLPVDFSSSVRPATRNAATNLIYCLTCDNFDHTSGLCPTLRHPAPATPQPETTLPTDSQPLPPPQHRQDSSTQTDPAPPERIPPAVLNELKQSLYRGTSLLDTLYFYGVSEDLFWSHFERD